MGSRETRGNAGVTTIASARREDEVKSRRIDNMVRAKNYIRTYERQYILATGSQIIME